MTHYIYVGDDGNHYVFTLGRGMARIDVGPRHGWPTPRQAVDYANALDRAFGGASPIPAVPLPGTDAEVPPEPRTTPRLRARRTRPR